MANTAPRTGRQGPHSDRHSRRRIPTAHAANSVAVTDGATLAGHVVEVDGKHHAFDSHDRWLGAFKSRAAAVAALPVTDCIGVPIAVDSN
jgi:hypothetical protein